jgi:Uma2 family endonuclease
MLDTQRLNIASNSSEQYLPPGSELWNSDDIPVDNEDQNWIPNVLLMLLKNIWIDRHDWFFGVDMGVYHATSKNARVPIVPDGFLSLGIERRKNNKSRRSYVVWEEKNVAPILALEVVSWTPGGEYDDKQAIYAKLGVLYYVIYNPEFWRRDGHQPFEVYKLINGAYQLQIGEPFWMPEIGLGIGRCPEIFDRSNEEVLSWYDERGDRYLRSEEKEIQANVAATQAKVDAIQAKTEAIQAKAEAERAKQRAEKLLAKLQELGIDADSLE